MEFRQSDKVMELAQHEAQRFMGVSRIFRIRRRSGGGCSPSAGHVLPGAGCCRWRDDGAGVSEHDQPTAAVVAPGLMVLAIILFMGRSRARTSIRR